MVNNTIACSKRKRNQPIDHLLLQSRFYLANPFMYQRGIFLGSSQPSPKALTQRICNRSKTCRDIQKISQVETHKPIKFIQTLKQLLHFQVLQNTCYSYFESSFTPGWFSLHVEFKVLHFHLKLFSHVKSL